MEARFADFLEKHEEPANVSLLGVGAGMDQFDEGALADGAELEDVLTHGTEPLSGESWAELLLTHHWDHLVREAERALFSYAHAHAEDLVAGLIAHVTTGRFKEFPNTTERVLKFAKGVVRNRARDINRREARWVQSPGQSLLEKRLVAAADLDPLLRREIEDALAHLTPREREVSKLHWLDGWPTPQLAEKLDIRPRTVKELLRRARRKLRERLAP